MKHLIIAILACGGGVADAEELLRCGVADGYPPYQYIEDKRPAGVDVDWLKLVAKEAGKKLEIIQTRWDDVVAMLRFGKIDCVGGMEINEDRKKLFDFTDTYYERRIVVFVLKTNKDIKTLDDLVYKKIAGDRQSFVERYFESKRLLHKIRVMYTDSKEESMRRLRDGELEAVVAPKAVGLFLSRQLGAVVRILQDSDPGSPVGMAVRKGDKRMLNLLDLAMKKLFARNAFQNINARWLTP